MTTTTQFLLATCLSLILAGSKALETDQVVDPEEIRKLTLPPSPSEYEAFTDWETWEASPEMAKLLPWYRSGYDKDGLVVYIMEFGKWNAREFTQLPEGKMEEALKFYEQLLRGGERDGSLNNNQGVVLIIDYDGFSLAHYASGPALKTSLQLFAPLLRVNHAMKYGFIVNANYAAETFFAIGKAFFGVMLDKMEIYGTRSEKWKPMLLRQIAASQVPPKYGGSQDWKPLPLLA